MDRIYKISIDSLDNETGLDAISLVEYPAVEVNFLTFSKDNQIQLKFEDDEKHIITGVAILADTPIYRVDPDGSEYYVVFEKQEIEKLVTKYFKQNYTNFVNIEHNDKMYVNDVTMIESIIINKERGICPVEFSSVPDGSWIVSFKVDNLDVWDKIKSGEVKGFSVQGLFNILEKNTFKTNKNKSIKNKMSRLREALKSLLMKFNELETDNGKLEWEEDAQLEVGYNVYIDDLPAPDGEYKTNDKIFVVKDGKVEEIKDVTVEDMAKKSKQKCEEEKPAEEKKEEEKKEEEMLDEKTVELENRIVALETKLAEIEEKLNKLIAEPAATPVVDEFNAINKPNVLDSKLKKAIAIASAFKK